MTSDLEANRRGEVTDEQRRAIAAGLQTPKQLLLAIASAALVMAVIGFRLALPGMPHWILVVLAAMIGSPIAVPLAISLLRSRRIARDLAEAVVAHDEGSVLFRRGSYVGFVPGRGRLNIRGTLEPGQYLFHYLPRSGMILSAERRSSELDGDLEILKDLARTLHFGRASLAANRAGRLGPFQLLRLAPPIGGNLIAAAVCAGAVVYLVQSILLNPPSNAFLLKAVGIIVAAVVGWFFFHECRASVADWRGGVVEHVDGPATRSIEQGRYWNMYSLAHGAVTFNVSQRAYNALVETVQYRVYFLPRSKVFLSMEPARLVKIPIENLHF